jgi:hypothetical protein
MMIRTFAFAAALAVSTAAFAAPPGFCDRYAHEAVHEFRANVHIPECFHGENARWHDNFDVHFNWCLHVSEDKADEERDIRRAKLHECRDRLHW